jgi:DNA modification methylase
MVILTIMNSKPYYQDDSCTIHHGDCLEILPTLADQSIDLVLTDPPYGIKAGGNSGRGGKQYGKALAASKQYDTTFNDDSPCSPKAISEMQRVGKGCIIFGGNYFVLPPSSCWLVWDKDNGKNRYADCELAWTNLSGAVRRVRYRWNGMLKERPEKRYHPTQKPLQVIQWAMSLDTRDGIILDPFMGSGTTLEAAKQLGRKAIGIELEEKYCEIAAERLQQEYMQFG